MAEFLYLVLTESNRYAVDIISLAMSSRDENSLRLFAPRSWMRSVRITNRKKDKIMYMHIGTVGAEFEFQRYQPRLFLTKLLNQYDLIQVVAGYPAWAFATRDAQPPVCLFTATTLKHERVSALKRVTGWKRIWLKSMTQITAHIEQTALHHIACVFAESEYTRQSLSSLVPSERLFLGLPGIDTDVFIPTSYCSDGYILSVGRFSDLRKNVRMLFDAYHRLRQKVVCAPRLILVGSPPAQSDWDYAISIGISEWIDIHDDIPRLELVPFYRGAGIFVLSSDEEGLGLVILEAMASGLPVVSTRCGGPETAVQEGETGYLTPVGDAQALADALQNLLENPNLRRQMGAAGRQVAEERFSIAAAGQVFLERYDELLASDPR
jgi:glycosyltransferase involved in cell wall biosynthesis